MGVLEPPVDAGDGLAAQHMTIGLASDAQRLNALDDIWTAYLEDEPEPATVERDLPALRVLVTDMCNLLERLSFQCGELRGLIGELDVDLDEELRRILGGGGAGQALLEALPESPFAGQVVDACSIVQEEAPAEIDALREKLHRLAEEGYSPGDIGGRLKCAILLAGSGASLVGLVLSPVAIVPGMVVGGAGILISTLAAANGWSCRRAGDIATAS